MRLRKIYAFAFGIVIFCAICTPRVLRSQLGCGTCTGYCSSDADCIDCGPDSTCDGFFCVNYTPVLVDVEGDGYHMTSTAEGVIFDMFGKGNRVRLSWTAPKSDDAWLALDRNGNGRIDDGTELFGGHTPVPGVVGRLDNGFDALAVYDQTVNGGNGDGVIDSRDAVYATLVLWADKNHDARSDASELSSLSAAGVQAINLRYHKSQYVDRYGNTFRYRAAVTDEKGAEISKWAYDVFLVPERKVNAASGWLRLGTPFSRSLAAYLSEWRGSLGRANTGRR